MREKTIFLELNEFNRDLLVQCAEIYNLSSIKRVLQMRETKTFCADSYESDYLEPWSQWVSVHTSTRSSQHLIKHLGDVSRLSQTQIWEKHDAKGISTGVWGAINGKRGQTNHCQFFIPDPWTFSEDATPKKYNYLVQLPRYFAKNRSNLKFSKIVTLMFGFLKILLNPRVVWCGLASLPRFLNQILRDGPREYVLFTLFEALSTYEFIRVWKKTKPEVSFLFLNSMAHVQHYYWNLKELKNDFRFRYTMHFINLIFDEVLKLNTEIILFNGLSQQSTEADQAWISYRPKDHDAFLNLVAIKYKKVEPLMSYDAIILFNTAEEKEQARQILSHLKIKDQPLLVVEDYLDDKLRLFYRLAYTDELASDSIVQGTEISFRFFDHLVAVTRRTGKHIPEGNLFSSLEIFPELVENTEVMSYFESSKV